MGGHSLVSRTQTSELPGVHECDIYSHHHLLRWLLLAYALIAPHGTLLGDAIGNLLFLLKSPLDRISQ